MKKLLMLVIALCLVFCTAFALVGCEGCNCGNTNSSDSLSGNSYGYDSVESDDSSISNQVGMYFVQSAKYDRGGFYAFASDGTYIVKINDSNSPGTTTIIQKGKYSVNNSVLTLIVTEGYDLSSFNGITVQGYGVKGDRMFITVTGTPHSGGSDFTAKIWFNKL